MKAIHFYKPDHPDSLVYEEMPRPIPAHGEVLVKVQAAGVTPTELTWSTNWIAVDGKERHKPVPGHELSGLIEEVGAGVVGLKQGDVVYGLTDFTRDGAFAEYAIALPAELAPRPGGLDSVQAAALPMGALTAWQALFEQAELTQEQTVLIHGAAGGVGCIAVQLAHWAGARVIATASADNSDFVRGLGADETIDYKTVLFEDVAKGVNIVLDLVGGEVQERSWSVLRSGGRLVSIVKKPSMEQATAHNAQGTFFIVRPEREQLLRINKLIEERSVRPVVDAILPLAQAPKVFTTGLVGHNRGKIVLKLEA